MYDITIGSNEANQRLDRFLRKYLKDTPLSDIYKMIRKKEVKVNGQRAKENQRLNIGDVLEIMSVAAKNEHVELKKAGRDFTIVFEDENILVVDKPPGLIIHPDRSHNDDTLVDQVVYYLNETGSYDPSAESTFAPAAVNRLDLNTGGLVMFAKNYQSLQVLSEMVRERMVEKRYICVVKGDVKGEKEIRAYLSKDEKSNKVKITDHEADGAKKIHTRIMPLKYANGWTLLEIDLITGRSHQIRAQLAAIDHPIIGDIKYGIEDQNRRFRDSFGLKNQLLYAYKLSFKQGAGELSYLKGTVLEAKLPESYNSIIRSIFD